MIVAFVLLAVFGAGDDIKGIQEMRYGIDIRGGVEAVFEPEGIDRKATAKELETARTVMEERLDGKNITDREVTVDKDGGYIIVRFPWKSGETNFNPEDAISELGEMAKLTFRAPDGTIVVEGKNVISSSAQQNADGTLTSYDVTLNFDEEGAKQFEEATGKLIGQTMGIYMDEHMISDPVVESKISGGQASITKLKSFEEAQELSQKINAGALPFSLKTTNFSTISPSLGNNALHIMILAGIVAFILVSIFMIVYYKLPGIVACVVLVLQMVLQLLAISIPQYTLTLPGIAGIILSLGMAVDANIIISERITEELKTGIGIRRAIKNGYKSAFTTVLDGNVTTAIVAIILMIFGSGAMLSFGYTLLVGMIVNVLVGVSVSKKMLQSCVEIEKLRHHKYFRAYKEKTTKRFYERKKIYIAISAAVFLLGIVGCFVNGVSLDTQFTGGVVLKYQTEDSINMEKVEEKVASITSRPVTVQMTKDNLSKKNSLVVTLAGTGGMKPEMQTEISNQLQDLSESGEVNLSETYVVEPYIGAKALKNACIAMIVSIIFIVLYIWIRFSELSAGVTAMLALVHDVFVVFFAFVIFKIPLNDAFVAVVLTIIGYSINDTIVLYDRIRERKKENGKEDVVQLVNASITQTFSRSVNTSITTGICVIVILIASLLFKITSITEFALPMFFGLLSGCYSSICIAGTIWAAWKKRKQK